MLHPAIRGRQGEVRLRRNNTETEEKMIPMPCYEFWSYDRNEWKEISETEIMNKLYKIYKRATPVIKEMIRGDVVQTPDGLYRLRFKGGG